MVIGYCPCSSDVPTPPEPPQLPDGDNPLYRAGTALQAGNAPISVYSTDLDGNGSNDLAVANWYSNDLSILRSNGDGTFQGAVNYSAGDGPRSLFSTDLT